MSPTPPVPRPESTSQSVFPDLDAAYRRQLETLARVRRAVATVATSRKRLELRLDELEQEDGQLESAKAAEIDEVRHQLDGLHAEERRVTEASQRLQVKVSDLHSAQQAVNRAYAAAEEAAKVAPAELTGTHPRS